jgi:ketosteroid isomerase-like protein
MADENLAIAEEMLQAVETTDVDAFERLLAEDVRHWIPVSSSERTGLPQPLEGREAVIGLFSRAPERFERLEYRVQMAVGGDEGAAVFATMDATLRDGREYENRYAWFFRIAGGRIVEIFEQPDTAYAYDFFAT